MMEKKMLFMVLCVALLVGVSQASVFSDDFEDGDISDWTITSGTSEVVAGPSGDTDNLVQQNATNNFDVANLEHGLGTTLSSWEVTFDLGFAGLSGSNNAGIAMLNSAGNGYLYWQNSEPKSDGTRIYRISNGLAAFEWDRIGTASSSGIAADTLSSIKVTYDSVNGHAISRWDGSAWAVLISGVMDDTYAEPNTVVLNSQCWVDQYGRFDNVVVRDMVSYMLTVEASPGVVTSTSPAPGIYPYPQGTIVELGADRFVGCPDVYAFDHWEGDVSLVPGPERWTVVAGPVGDSDNLLQGDSDGDHCTLGKSLGTTITSQCTITLDSGWSEVSSANMQYVALLNDADKGYVLRVSSGATGDKYKIYRVENWGTTLWTTLGFSAGDQDIPNVALVPAKFIYNPTNGNLAISIWEDMGGTPQWVEKVTANDNSVSGLNKIVLMMYAWDDQYARFDNVDVVLDGLGSVLSDDFTDGDITDWTVIHPAPAVTVTMDASKTVRAVYVDDRTCGDECYPNPTGDESHDCLVDLQDFSIFSSHWLEDNNP